MPETTRDRLLDAAAELAGRGRLPALGVVAARAGVSRATLYQHFAGRGELCAALAAERDVGVAAPRMRILDAAADLIAERGLAATTMEEVARRAEVGIATVYRIFDDRDGLLRAFGTERTPQRLAGELSARPSGDVEADVTALAAAALRFVADNRALFQLMFARDPESEALLGKLGARPDTTREALGRYLSRVLAAKPAHGRKLAHAFLGMVAVAALLDESPFSADPDGAARFVARLFLYGALREVD